MRGLFLGLMMIGVCIAQAQNLNSNNKSIGVLASDKKLSVEEKKEQIKEQMIGKPLPAFSLFDLDSVLYNNETLKGKVTLLCVWEIGCMPCMWELPRLSQLKKDYKGKDFILFSMTPFSKKMMNAFKGEKQEWPRMDTVLKALKSYYKLTSIDIPIVPTCDDSVTPDYLEDNIRIGDQCDYIEKNFLIASYPTTFIIDKKGIVRAIFFGFSTTSDVSEFTEKIDELLKE